MGLAVKNVCKSYQKLNPLVGGAKTGSSRVMIYLTNGWDSDSLLELLGDDKFYGLPSSGLSFQYQWDWFLVHVDVEFKKDTIGGSSLL